MKKILETPSEFENFGISKQVTNIDKFDIENFNRIKSSIATLLTISEKGEKIYEQFPQLHIDLYSILFRYAPQLLDDPYIDTSYLLNKHIISQIMEHPEYKELRLNTKTNELLSTVGTEIIGETILELLEKKKETQELLQDVIDKNTNVTNASNKNSNNKEDAGNETEEQIEQELTLQEAKKKLEEAKENLKENVKTPEFKKAINTLVKKTISSCNEITETIRNWGLESDDTFQLLPVQEKFKLMNKFTKNNKFREIAKLLGKLKMLALQRQHEKIKVGVQELYSIKTGNNLEKLLPIEKTKLISDVSEIETLFYNNLLEGKTLIYDIKTKSKKCKGPLVCCIDSSSSMSGEAEIWSKAVALSLLEIAIQQKRSMAAIHFSSNQNSDKLHVNYFPKNISRDINNVIDLAGYFEGGGTLFEPPLDRSRMIIEEELDFSKADIVFITDGESVVTDEWLQKFLKWKKEKHVFIYSILINTSTSSNILSLKEFSDKIHKLSEFIQGDKIAINVFESV